MVAYGQKYPRVREELMLGCCHVGPLPAYLLVGPGVSSPGALMGTDNRVVGFPSSMTGTVLKRNAMLNQHISL